jgi:hypothetical protein
MPTVRELAEELQVPMAWIITTMLSLGQMETASSELTEEEVALLRAAVEHGNADTG